jgi:hypothetical protein
VFGDLCHAGLNGVCFRQHKGHDGETCQTENTQYHDEVLRNGAKLADGSVPNGREERLLIQKGEIMLNAAKMAIQIERNARSRPNFAAVD